MDDIDEYLSGRALYGDDFSAAQIRDWFADEREGYANLGAVDASSYGTLQNWLLSQFRGARA